MDTILVVIVVAVAILLLKKAFMQPQVELKSDRDKNTRPERLITTPPRAYVTAVDENGEPVSELDPRVTEVSEHPVFKTLAPMVAAEDWGMARSFLQKIAYGIHDATADDQRIFKKIMTIFAEADPMYQQCMRGIKPFIEESPGIKQTALYPHMAAAPDTESCRYVLYFAHELGDIVRRKKGNSYEVFLPGQPMPEVTAKKSAGPKKVLTTKATTMKDTGSVVLQHFFSLHLAEGWQSQEVVYLDGWQTVEALWPMIEIFRPHFSQIASLPYLQANEQDADQALLVLANGGQWSATEPSTGAWRVLFERHTQSIAVAAANFAAGNAKLVPLPAGLPPAHHTLAAVLFLQWAMVLPTPPKNAPTFPWPEGAQPESLLQH